MKPTKVPDKKETIPAKYEFSTEELAELARKQGQLYQEMETLDAQRKHVAKDFSTRIEGFQAQLAEISNKTTCGYEFRPTECIVVFRPAAKQKDYFNAVTGKLIESRAMELADFQRSLPLDPDDDP